MRWLFCFSSVGSVDGDKSKITTAWFHCGYCNGVVPEANVELHQARCARVSTAIDESLRKDGWPGRQTSATREPSSHPRKHACRPKKPAPQERSKQIPHDDDLDSLLAEMKQLNSTCNYAGCKKNVKLIGVKCQFCSARFCLAHNIAEIHGCGEAAKRHAQQQLTRELVGGTRRKPVDPTRRAQLHRKLDRAVDELASSRQRKRHDKKQ